MYAKLYGNIQKYSLNGYTVIKRITRKLKALMRQQL